MVGNIFLVYPWQFRLTVIPSRGIHLSSNPWQLLFRSLTLYHSPSPRTNWNHQRHSPIFSFSFVFTLLDGFRSLCRRPWKFSVKKLCLCLLDAHSMWSLLTNSRQAWLSMSLSRGWRRHISYVRESLAQNMSFSFGRVLCHPLSTMLSLNLISTIQGFRSLPGRPISHLQHICHTSHPQFYMRGTVLEYEIDELSLYFMGVTMRQFQGWGRGLSQSQTTVSTTTYDLAHTTTEPGRQTHQSPVEGGGRICLWMRQPQHSPTETCLTRELQCLHIQLSVVPLDLLSFYIFTALSFFRNLTSLHLSLSFSSVSYDDVCIDTESQVVVLSIEWYILDCCMG